jgi:DNA-binding NtrC family response regulator
MADPANTVKARVLVVDEETVAHLAANALTKAGFETEACSNGNSALATVETGGADVVVCSVQMPGVNSMDLLRRMHARRPDVPVVMLAGDPSVNAAVAAMRQGAFDYVTKPFDDEALAAIVERALEMGCLKRENHRLREQLVVVSSAAGFVAESPCSKQLVAMVRQVALDCVDRGRERHRQGTDRAHVALLEQARRGSIRRGQLQGIRGRSGRERTVRP